MDMLNKLFIASSFALLAACTTAAVDGEMAEATMAPPGIGDLPEGVTQYSRTYWVLPEDEPMGPYFQVEDDVVTGLAYMVMQQNLIDGANFNLPVDAIAGLPGARSIVWSFSPGHAGMPQAHYDLTLELVPEVAAGPAPGLAELPAGVEQYSRTLWVRAEDQPMGPYFKVEGDKINGVAYVIMQQNIIDGVDMTFSLDTIAGLPAAQNLALSFSAGHAGMAMPHYDMTIELVSP